MSSSNHHRLSSVWIWIEHAEEIVQTKHGKLINNACIAHKLLEHSVHTTLSIVFLWGGCNSKTRRSEAIFVSELQDSFLFFLGFGGSNLWRTDPAKTGNKQLDKVINVANIAWKIRTYTNYFRPYWHFLHLSVSLLSWEMNS